MRAPLLIFLAVVLVAGSGMAIMNARAAIAPGALRHPESGTT